MRERPGFNRFHVAPLDYNNRELKAPDEGNISVQLTLGLGTFPLVYTRQ